MVSKSTTQSLRILPSILKKSQFENVAKLTLPVPWKSLSMSNLVMMENNDAADTTFSSNSSAKKSKMKAFLRYVH